MKILHLPSNVAGLPWALAQGQKDIGHDVEILSLDETKWKYPSGDILNISGRNRIGRITGYVAALLKHCRRHDAYVFNFGRSLLHFPDRNLDLIDLPLYPARSKKLFLYQGCDARQKYPTMDRNKRLGNDIAACFRNDCYSGACNSGVRDTQRRRAIEKAAKYADHMYAVNPDLLYFLPPEKSSFLPYTMPAMTNRDARTRPFFGDDKIRIVHSPTERGAKGTPFILAALEKIQEAFPGRVDVVLVEDKTNEEALDILRTADLLIDQVLIGWYGGVAVEAMNMGVPVACYINEEHLKFIPVEMASALPVIRLTPSNMVDVITGIVSEREQLLELSQPSIQFARQWHDPMRVASMMEPVISGTKAT